MNLALSMTVGSLGPSACLLIWSFYKVVVVVVIGNEGGVGNGFVLNGRSDPQTAGQIETPKSQEKLSL